MNDNTAFRITDKGRSEIAAKPGLLKPGLKRLLAAVGSGATALSLRQKFPNAGDITTALRKLARNGYLETTPKAPPTGPAQAQAVSPGGLDISGLFAELSEEPLSRQYHQPEDITPAARQLKAGYQISIVNRPGKPLPARGGGNHTVLLIDGHKNEALEAAQVLIQAGFDVRSASTKAEIVQTLGQPPMPDLIVMDVELPDAVGLDLLCKLHDHPDLKSTPILVVTARAQREDVVAALAYGASGYLNKPVKTAILLQHVRDALGLA